MVDHFIDDAVERLTPRFRGHDEMLRGMVTPPIVHAYQQGRHDAMSELMPVDDVATMLGVTRSYVHRLARNRGIGWTIGRERLFTPDDVAALRQRDTMPGPKPRKG